MSGVTSNPHPDRTPDGVLGGKTPDELSTDEARDLWEFYRRWRAGQSLSRIAAGERRERKTVLWSPSVWKWLNSL